MIDPGFNFIENFYNEGFKVADIDAVIITHAHNDHTVDLESILSLLYKLNKDRRQIDDSEKRERQPDKKIDLLCNAGTFMKFSGWLSLKVEDNNFINSVTVLHPSYEYNYAGLKIRPKRARHHEIVSSKYCIGLVIEAGGKDGFKLGLTSDTGWEHDGIIGQQYVDDKPDIMVVHIGTIKEKEFKYDKATTDGERQECYDNYHLGILGVTNLLDVVRPELTIISEFGEELREVRRQAADALSKTLEITCIPGDIGIYIRLSDRRILCFVQGDFVPAESLTIQPIKAGDESNLMYHGPCQAGEVYENAKAGRERWRKLPIHQRMKTSAAKLVN